MDTVEQAMDALKALEKQAVTMVSEMGAAVVAAGEAAARREFEARGDRLLADIRAQVEALHVQKLLGIASERLAGMVVVPVEVEAIPGGPHGAYRERSGRGDGAFRVAEGASGLPAFAVSLGPDRQSGFGHHSPFEDALRLGLPPGRYRFIGALVREDTQAPAEADAPAGDS